MLEGPGSKCQARSQFIGSKVADNIEVPFCAQVIIHDMALPMVAMTRVLPRDGRADPEDPQSRRKRRPVQKRSQNPFDIAGLAICRYQLTVSNR